MTCRLEWTTHRTDIFHGRSAHNEWPYCTAFLFFLWTEQRKRTWEKKWPSRGCWQSVRISTRTRASDAWNISPSCSGDDGCAHDADFTCVKSAASSTRTTEHTSADSVSDNSKHFMMSAYKVVNVCLQWASSMPMGHFNFWLSLSLSDSLSETLSWMLKSGLRPKFNLTLV